MIIYIWFKFSIAYIWLKTNINLKIVFIPYKISNLCPIIHYLQSLTQQLHSD